MIGSVYINMSAKEAHTWILGYKHLNKTETNSNIYKVRNIL